jgi:uncharacterized protein
MKHIVRLLTCLLTALAILLPVHADETEWVRDDSGVLTTEDIQTLQETAADTADSSAIGVYIRFTPDQGFASSIEEYAETIWNEEGLGLGSEREGVMLVIDTSRRQYDILAHGDRANTAFTDYGKEELADAMMPYLRETDYAMAAMVFASECQNYVTVSEEGQPVDTWIPDSTPVDPEEARETARKVKLGFTLGLPPVIALIICLILRQKNRAKSVKQEAGQYLEKHGLKLTGAQDILLYTTRHVTHIPRNTNNGGGGGHWGGTSVNSGGFSHSSGSF